MKKIYILSLGCPRNLVDSEVLLGRLQEKGHTFVDDPLDADVGIVNTCGFIRDAKEESINAILQLAELKKKGAIDKVIVTGCLSQRYPDDIISEISEVDGVFGTADIICIPDMIERMFSGEKVRSVSDRPGFLYDHTYRRNMLTPPHFVYLKIQEGCSNRCSYCVIPDLKGPRRSRSIESVVEEVRGIASSGEVKELVVVGQDTTSFGMDTSGRSELPSLLRRISPIMKGGWVRLLYAHPAHFTDELMEVIADTDNICKYVDLPIQHINDRILKLMNRVVTRGEVVALLTKLRSRIKGLTVRTSIIVGFPTETDKEFDELYAFLEEARFERLGAFLYSREEGTPAYGFTPQIDTGIITERFDRVMCLQQRISSENNMELIGRTLRALVDESDATDPVQFVGRTVTDAPEVDGVVYIRGRGLRVGEFVDVKITGTMEYDLIGEAQ